MTITNLELIDQQLRARNFDHVDVVPAFVLVCLPASDDASNCELRWIETREHDTAEEVLNKILAMGLTETTPFNNLALATFVANS